MCSSASTSPPAEQLSSADFAPPMWPPHRSGAATSIACERASERHAPQVELGAGSKSGAAVSARSRARRPVAPCSAGFRKCSVACAGARRCCVAVRADCDRASAIRGRARLPFVRARRACEGARRCCAAAHHAWACASFACGRVSQGWERVNRACERVSRAFQRAIYAFARAIYTICRESCKKSLFSPLAISTHANTLRRSPLENPATTTL